MKRNPPESHYLTPASYVDRSCYIWQFALCALVGLVIGGAFAYFF